MIPLGSILCYCLSLVQYSCMIMLQNQQNATLKENDHSICKQAPGKSQCWPGINRNLISDYHEVSDGYN